MSNRKIVQHTICPTGKRSFEDEYDADKALGRARAKHFRSAGNSRRGLTVENRSYYCGQCDGFHLTSQSRRSFETVSGRMAFA